MLYVCHSDMMLTVAHMQHATEGLIWSATLHAVTPRGRKRFLAISYGFELMPAVDGLRSVLVHRRHARFDDMAKQFRTIVMDTAFYLRRSEVLPLPSPFCVLDHYVSLEDAVIAARNAAGMPF